MRSLYPVLPGSLSSALVLPPLWTPPKLWTAPWWRLPMWFAEGKQKVHTTSRKLRAGTLSSKVRVSTATATFCCHCCCPCKIASFATCTLILDGVTNICGHCPDGGSTSISTDCNGTYTLTRVGSTCLIENQNAKSLSITFYSDGACATPTSTQTYALALQINCNTSPKIISIRAISGINTGSLIFRAILPEDLDCNDMTLDNLYTTTCGTDYGLPAFDITGNGGTATIIL